MKGFGFLATRGAGLRILGSVELFSLQRSSTVRMGSADEHRRGNRWCAVTYDEQLISIVDRDLKRVLGIRSQPRNADNQVGTPFHNTR